MAVNVTPIFGRALTFDAVAGGRAEILAWSSRRFRDVNRDAVKTKNSI